MKAFPNRSIQILAFIFFALLISTLVWNRGTWLDRGHPPATGDETGSESSVGLSRPAAPRSAEAVDRVHGVLRQSLRVYEALDSYQADFHKRERSEDDTWREERMFLKFEKPFSLYMHWTAGDRRGTEILYSRGHYENKILVRPAGFLFRFIPIIHLAADDPRVRESETHSIEHAGVGYFLTEFLESFDESAREDRVEILSEETVEVAGERARRFNVWFDDPTYDYPRTEVAISETHGLPIEIRLFDSQARMAEVYRYLSLRTDTPRDDAVFKEVADFRLYDLFVKRPRETTESGSRNSS